MDANITQNAPMQTRTAINCTKCGKAASVPFTPTPGRPVFCRDCFQRPPAPGGPPAQGGGGGGAGGGSGGSHFRAGPPRVHIPRKRMMAQGRKTHFLYDAKAALHNLPGGMDDKDARAFLEGLFARGARGSTEAAQEFLDEKEREELITSDQRNALGRLVERYSFYR